MGKIRRKPVDDNKGDLATAGIKFTKDKGQHILKNPLVIKTMIEKSGIKPSDIVMEIGPGTGNLTIKLLDKAKQVNAFEVDKRMVAELKKRVLGTENQRKLNIIVGDVIREKNWPKFDLIVANLPYQISSPFIKRLISIGKCYRCAIVMVQKEFADRLLAKPGDKIYSRLSVNVQLHCKIYHLMKIDRNSFRPPPKVDSSVIRIEPRHPKPPVSEVEMDELLRICFQRKNKTLNSNFGNTGVIRVLLQKFLKNQKYLIENNLELNRTIEDLENFTADDMHELSKKVLVDSNYSDKRARNMTEEDFLIVLLHFKKSGIVFE